MEVKIASLSIQTISYNFIENLLNTVSTFATIQNIIIQVLRFIDRTRHKNAVPDFQSVAERKRASKHFENLTLS